MEEAQLIFPAFWEDPSPYSANPQLNHWAQSQPELEACVFFQTSGTTAAPKWLALPKSGLLLSAAVVNRHLHVTPSSIWGLTLPTHHVGGFGVIARAFEAACPISRLPNKWNATAFTAWISREKITHTSLVPTQIFDLVNENCHAPSSLQAIVVGGGALEISLGQKARDLGWPILASFGMTEASSQIATQSLDALHQPFSPHFLPILPHWHWQTNESSHLMLSGPSLFTSTIHSTPNGWQSTPRQDPWFTTQDLVKIHENTLTPLGRSSLEIKILGELVNLEALEQQFLTTSSLPPNQAALVALPHPRRGHTLALATSSQISHQQITQALEKYHQTQPSLTHISQRFTFPNLPLSPLGKIQRNTLTQWCQGQQSC